MKSPESSLISGLQEPIVEIVKLLLLINTLLSVTVPEMVRTFEALTL